jgi:alpha-L-fucosidase
VYGELEPGQQPEQFARDKKGIVFDDPTTVRQGRLKLHDGDIRYTQSKNGKSIYAARLAWTEEHFTLASFSATGVGKGVKVSSVSLLGSNEKITWVRTENGITITPPAHSPLADASWPVIFKIDTK